MQNPKSLKYAGFTLVEILVVLFIIGITLSAAILAFGDFGVEKKIISSAEQFSNYVKLIQQEAIIKNETLGIIIGKNGYQAAHLVNNNWQKIKVKQSFPARTQVSVKKTRGPHVIINANGDLSPFHLKFSSRKNPNIINVIGKNDGSIALE